MEFKLGDTVKNVKNNSGKKYDFLVGKIGEVVAIDTNYIQVYMKEFKNKVSSGIFAFYDDEIELVP
jgi:hypothetical protein